MLIHGAWADASGWDGVITRLRAKGYTVIAPANPLRGLTGDSAYIKSILTQAPGPLVVVGHSYGGAVITNAAAGVPNVRALVYIDAFAPAKGENILQLTGAGSQIGGAIELKPIPPFGANDVDVYIKQSMFRHVFAGDLPRSAAALMAAEQRPLFAAATAQPTYATAWSTIPSWYLVGLDDRVITPAEQRFMAHRAGSHIVSVHASHVSMISHPRLTARLIERAATATG